MSLELGPGVALGPGVRIDPAYEVATSGLVISLDANEFSSNPSSGATWTNQVAGSTFTLPNGATYSSANGGKLTFNGTDQSAHGTDAGALSTFTAETWVYFNTIPTVGGTATATITEVYSGTPINYAICCGVNGSDATLWQGGFFTGSSWQVAGTLIPSLNTWYCLAVTYDASTISFYVNGAVNDSVIAGGAPGSSGLGIHVGERWDAPAYPATFLDGSVPVVRLYNRALSNAEVLGNFNALKGRFGL